MSVNASQPELNQLIYRHLKQHGFLSAAEEFQRHSPQGEANSSVSLLDIYTSWLNNPKKKKRSNSAGSSKSRQGKTPSKAKTVSPRKKTEKTVKTPVSLKKPVKAKRKGSNEKPSQSPIKAKKSKLDTTETAPANGSDSDSSLDVEKWKKLLDQLTEVDVAKMETINALTSSEPQAKKKRVRKPRAKPVPKADAHVQQNGGTVGQNEKKGAEKVVTLTKTNTAKRSRKENVALVSSPNKLSPNKRAKGLVDIQASSSTPEKQAQLQEMSVSVNVGDEKAYVTSPEPKKKKKKKKEETEEEREGSAEEINSDGKEKAKKKMKKREITEQEDPDKTEDTKRAAEEGKVEETNSNNADISILGLHKKKAKKKEKDKTRREENLAQIDEKEKKKMVVIENSEPLNEEIISNANKAGSDKKPKENVQDKKAKKRKEKKDVAGNLEYANVGEKENVEQNIEEKELLQEIVKKKKDKKKKETYTEEHLAQTHEKKKKTLSNNEDNPEQVDKDIKENTEQILTDENEVQSEKKGEQNDQGKKAKKKKKKEKSNTEGISEHVTVAEEEHAKENVEENSEQMGEKKKLKKKKKESLGNEESPEEVVREKKAKKKKKSNKEDLEQTVEEDTPKDEGDHSNDKSTLETSELSPENTTTPKKKKKKKNKLKSDEVPEEAVIPAQDVSVTQINSDDVHKKKKKSKSKES